MSLDDGRSDCVHVGFVYSLPELYGIIIVRESRFLAKYNGFTQRYHLRSVFRLNKDTKLCRIRIRRGQRRRTSNIFYFGVFIQ